MLKLRDLSDCKCCKATKNHEIPSMLKKGTFTITHYSHLKARLHYTYRVVGVTLLDAFVILEFLVALGVTLSRHGRNFGVAFV